MVENSWSILGREISDSDDRTSHIGHDWQFSEEQKELLRQYHGANKLLVDCLNSDCYISRTVREEIENTLLLPISSI